jgi:RNA-directed DNA polymerase
MLSDLPHALGVRQFCFMRYSFPTTWRINKITSQELAGALHIDKKSLKQLEKKIPSQYSKAPIKKRNGDIRWLSVPSNELKEVQRTILADVFRIQFPDYIQGGVRERSIVTNASLHRRKKWIACLDISKFFPSVHHSQINQIFLDLSCPQEVATILTHFTSYQFELPQGAPTSPTIANLVLYNLDVRIQRLCQLKQLTYSRYFDDITISGNRKLDAACDKVIEIASDEGFKIHKDDKEKFRKMPSWSTQTVTGIVVSGKRLEPSTTFVDDFGKTLELLKAGGQPEADFYKILATAKGMISFLNSVNVPMAKQFKRNVQNINWEKYGLTTPLY